MTKLITRYGRVDLILIDELGHRECRRGAGTEVIDAVTASGITVARHRLAANGIGAIIRDHRHEERIPPGPAALAADAALRGPNQRQHLDQ